MQINSPFSKPGSPSIFRPGLPFSPGFTLLEIMISMAIFGMLTLAIYSAWTVIINASQVGLKSAAEAQRRRNAVETIQNALFGVQMSTANLRHHYFLADTTQPEAALLSFVSLLPDSFPGSGLFPGSPMRRVTFALDVDKNGQQNLILYQTPVLAALDAMSEPIPIKLAQDVSVFGAEFYDESLSEWLAAWDNTNALPKQVRFAIVFNNRSENSPSTQVKPDAEMRVVTIPSSAIPIQIQRPGLGNLSRNPGVQNPNSPNPPQPVPGAQGTGGISDFRSPSPQNP
ncbi:MAG: prepilin-type N-terminal cleavage/methylation domain-containing protein [Verrucomicrobia bacterium]|nr:prepilin-type N-terminal cleavage/methylation domain-containing protein [Verrucomicrobiota bacterium]